MVTGSLRYSRQMGHLVSSWISRTGAPEAMAAGISSLLFSLLPLWIINCFVDSGNIQINKENVSFYSIPFVS